MTERLVDIPVKNETREQLKSIKGIATYDQFIMQLIRKNSSPPRSQHGGPD